MALVAPERDRLCENRDDSMRKDTTMLRTTTGPSRRMRKAHMRPALGVGFLVAAALLVVACGSNSNEASTTNEASATALSTTWSLPNADLQNSRYVGGPIDSSNV